MFITRDHRLVGRTPPDVGAADPSSAIDIPTVRMKKLATNHCRGMNLTTPKFREIYIYSLPRP